MTQATPPSTGSSSLDALTGGAFSAPTSGERAARLRQWLASDPSADAMQAVYRELSSRDKGAARVLRERLDEIKRAKGQEALAGEWATKAEALLGQAKLNIADALAWQRDAAKAGAPLSREPLAGLKARLADRVKAVEDLQHRVQVQREAAVLLAQRIEVLSVKPWGDAQTAAAALRADVPDWQAQALALTQDVVWPSIDPRFPPLLEASRNQLQVVWEAFESALTQAAAADADPTAALPPVPAWADELRVARGLPAEAPARPARPAIDPQVRAAANEAVRAALAKVEQEVAEGHGKASAGAAAALRNMLKEHGKRIDPKLEQQAHAALATAGEMEGWQRWRTDQLRQELVAKAEALFEPVGAPKAGAAARGSAPQAAAQPATATTPAEEAGEQTAETAGSGAQAPAPAPETPVAQTPAPAAARKPRFGGRKMQEQLRALREQWKQLDQGGAPNHALWKRFDEACNEAYKVVEAWLDKVKAEAAEHRARRLALIEEVKAWAAAHTSPAGGDWKGFARAIHQFEGRWREAGHLSEKAFAEMQPQWKAVLHAAEAPLAAAQKQSLERRHAMIEEATALGAAPQLRVDAVKALQQRWQAEAQTVPLDRKQEQKLWDAFRKPIDEAFQRKGQERDRAAASLSERDRLVLEASKAVEAANASGDAQKIREALAALEAALRGQAQARQDAAKADAQEHKAQPEAGSGVPPESATDASATQLAEAVAEAGVDAAADLPAPAPVPAAKPAPKPVIARRGDDRPGMKRDEPAVAGRGARPGDRKGPGGPGGGRAGAPGGRFGDRGSDRYGDRAGPRGTEDRGPRLGDVAFRAQREAVEHAQAALRKLAAQAHGEALTQLLAAWEQRSAEQVPSQSELGKAVTPAVRGGWVQAIGSAPSGDASEALLRLEMASQVPTPADQLNARRALQLQLLTRRNDPSPEQTWGQDAAKVFATAHQPATARRLQAVLKALLRA